MFNPIKFFKSVARKIIYFFQLPGRVSKLEYYNFNRRYHAVEQIAAYSAGAKIEGDYLEFGVYKGDIFIHAYKWMAKLFPKMRFLAYDSFEGLPTPKGVDDINGYSSNYHENEFACSEEEFIANLKKEKVDLRRVKTIKGWYDKTLVGGKVKDYKIKKIAVVWIDCDLYESTVPVLKYITPYLTGGTIIVFDDWHAFRNNPGRGEQKACAEWLKKNPKIKLSQIFSYGYGGVVFTVIEC